MTKIDANLMTAAKKIAYELNKKDGSTSDNKILKTHWDAFALSKGAKDNVREYIGIAQAEKSIYSYLLKNASKKESARDLGAKWLEEVSVPETTENPQDDYAHVLEIDEVVITSERKRTGVLPSGNIGQFEVPAQLPITEIPVSTHVTKPEPEILAVTKQEDLNKAMTALTDKPDINSFVKLAKMTKTSSAKASNEQINNDVLSMAFDNVIRDLMKKGNKPRSVLLGTAKNFLAAAKEHNVDTFALMGISMIESAYGTSKMALTKNNVGGLTPNGRNGITCQTVGDSINIAARTLHNNIYKKGLDSINSVGMKGNYCCADSNKRALWVSNVTFFANKVKDEYNRLLAEFQKA